MLLLAARMKLTAATACLVFSSACFCADCPDFSGKFAGGQDTYSLTRIVLDNRESYKFDHDGYDQALIVVGNIDDEWKHVGKFLTDYVPRMYCLNETLVHLDFYAGTISETRFRLTSNGELSVAVGLYLPGREFPLSSETIYVRER